MKRFAVFAVPAAVVVGVLLARTALAAFAVLAAGVVLAAAPILVSPEGFDWLAALMFVTLPFYSAFVIDIGLTLRLSYVFGAGALAVGAAYGRLRGKSLWFYWGLLSLLVVAVLASIALNPVVPRVPPLAASGLRGVPGIRPLLQVVQLVGMIGLMLVTISYCRSRPRVARASTLVIAGGVFVIAYAFYQFAAMSAHWRIVDLNNAMNTDFTFGYKEQNNSYAGGTIPRPRSTFPEPSNFANFLLMATPLMAWRLTRARGRASQIAWAAFIAATAALFFVAVNSRGAIYGALFAAAALMLFARTPHEWTAWLTRAGIWLAGGVVAVAAAIEGFYKGGFVEFFCYMAERLNVALDSTNRVNQDWQMVSRVFRDHPVYGVGFGNLTYYIGRLEGTPLAGVTDAGGLYQRLLAEVGFVGVACYAAFVGAILVGLLRIGRRSVDAEAVVLARVLFFAIVADAVQRVSIVGLATDAYLWVGFGLALSLIDLELTPSKMRSSAAAPSVHVYRAALAGPASRSSA